MSLEDYTGQTKILALIILIKKQFNVIRAELGLPPITNEQIKEAFKNQCIELGHRCEELEES